MLMYVCTNLKGFFMFDAIITGNILGVVKNYTRLVETFRAARRRGFIDGFVSIYAHMKTRTVQISSDGGRLCRPYIIVTNGKPRVKQKHVDRLIAGKMDFERFLVKGTTTYLRDNTVVYFKSILYYFRFLYLLYVI